MMPNANPSVLSSQPAQCFGSFRLHSDGTLFHDDKQIHLAPKELAALRVLLRRAGTIVTPAQLQEELWGAVHVTPDSVPRCLSALRTRLGIEGGIQTVYKQGYRLMLPVTQESGGGSALPRLAIMPFALGPGAPEHLGRAVAEEATAQLTTHQPRVFQMLARDSVFTLAARGMTAQQAGEALKADLVLTGTVQEMAAHFRLRAEMVRVEDGTQIWVEDLLVRHEQIAELAGMIVQRLAFRAGCPPARHNAAPQPAVDPHAYDLFLRARHEWQSLDRHRMQEGIRHLQRSVEIDPKLAQVPLEIVRATVARELFGFIEPSAAAEQIEHIARSLEDSPDRLAGISPALAWFALHVDRDVAGALRLLHRTEGIAPDGCAFRMQALIAAARHRFTDAASALEQALETDPFSPWLGASLAWMYHLADQGQESLRQIEHCLEIAPDHTASYLYGGMILAFRGDPGKAVALTSELTGRSPHFDMSLAVHAYALARNGEREKAEELLERLQWLSRERYVVRSFSAAAYLALNDADSALAELDAANQNRCPWFFQMLGDPRLHALGHRPEYRQLLALVDQAEAEVKEESAVEEPEPAATAN